MRRVRIDDLFEWRFFESSDSKGRFERAQRLPKVSGSKSAGGGPPVASETSTTLCPVSSNRLRQRRLRQATSSSTRTMYERACAKRFLSSSPTPRGSSFFLVRTIQRTG